MTWRYRRRLGMAFSLLAVALVAAVGPVATPDPRLDGAPDAPRSTAAAPVGVRARPESPARDLRAELRRWLDQRAAAVRGADRARWLSAVDPKAPGLVSDQADLFDRVTRVPLDAWSYELLDVAEGPGATGRDEQVVRVLLHYRLAGYDITDVAREQVLTVARTDEGWRLTGQRAGSSGAVGEIRGSGPQELWDLGPVTIRQGKRSLVVAAGAGADLNRYVREADAAVAVVSRVWPRGWPRRVVVLVPATSGDMTAVVGGGNTGLSRLAAVTTGQVTADGRTTGDRVVVNPTTFPTLDDIGRRVVLAHETAHVATRAAATGHAPMWLSEGFADYIAYRDSGVPVTVAAGTLLEQVRAGRVPARLPTQEDFDATSGGLSTAYEAAWLACRLIAERYGAEALLAFYRAVAAADGGSGDHAVAHAFTTVLDTTEAAFVADWRAHLRSLAAR